MRRRRDLSSAPRRVLAIPLLVVAAAAATGSGPSRPAGTKEIGFAGDECFLERIDLQVAVDAHVRQTGRRPQDMRDLEEAQLRSSASAWRAGAELIDGVIRRVHGFDCTDFDQRVGRLSSRSCAASLIRLVTIATHYERQVGRWPSSNAVAEAAGFNTAGVDHRLTGESTVLQGVSGCGNVQLERAVEVMFLPPDAGKVDEGHEPDPLGPDDGALCGAERRRLLIAVEMFFARHAAPPMSEAALVDAGLLEFQSSLFDLSGEGESYRLVSDVAMCDSDAEI
jgi:hypothetical protein